MEYTRLDDCQPDDEDVTLPFPRLPHRQNSNADGPVSDPPSDGPLSLNSVRAEKHSRREELNAQGETLSPPLRYRWRSIYLLLFYIPLLVVPWVLTCVLAVRPLNGRSYIKQGGGLSLEEIKSIGFWFAAVQTLNSIGAIVTIPIISALLAQAAVVYSQRRRANQSLSITQLFALADRGWSDITVLRDAFGPNKAGTSSCFLWLAAVFMITAAIQPPIQKMLVVVEEVTVMTCRDDPRRSCARDHLPITVGYDPEPVDMSSIPQNNVVQEFTNQIASFSQHSRQPRLWADNPNLRSDENADHAVPADSGIFYWYSKQFPQTKGNFFVTAHENGTTTGVLREHAMRLNSSIKCSQVPRSTFPRTCPGARPFITSVSHWRSDIRVCVPSEYGVYPWTLTRHRQDLAEELFIDISIPNPAWGQWTTILNFTLHCQAETTRGYFELGNYRNSYSYGPLLATWPGLVEMKAEFNHYLGWYRNYSRTSDNEMTPNYTMSRSSSSLWGTGQVVPFGTRDLVMPGPLMTSAIAIFGNQSFFYIAANAKNSTFPRPEVQICQQGNIPFSRLSPVTSDNIQSLCEDILSYRERSSHLPGESGWLLSRWAIGFNNTNSTEDALAASMYFANQAMLTQTADAFASSSARDIFTAPGLVILRPAMTLAGTTIVSTLIFFQLFGLMYVLWYIYQVPTWTPALDAIAVARIGACLQQTDLPPIGPVYGKDKAKLKLLDGLVGLIEAEPNDASGGDLHSSQVDGYAAAPTSGNNIEEADDSRTSTPVH